MNLWFRLLITLLLSVLRKRAGPFETTVTRFRVLPNDLDFNGHMNNGRYMTLADLARLDFVVRTGSAAIAINNRAWPIVGDVTAKFRKELKLFQRYEIHSRLLGWDDRWTFMEHRFVRLGRVAAVVTMRGMFVSARGPVAPATFLHALAIEAKAPDLPRHVEEWSDSCDRLSDSLRLGERHATACSDQ